MKEFRIFTVLKQASSTVSNIRSIKCRSSINSKKNSEFQMRFESIRTSGQITAGRWVQIPSGFQIFNKTGISVKLDLRKFCCWLIRYLTKYLLIKCMNYYNNNNILWNKNFKEIHTCWSRKSTSFPKGQLIPSDLICCCNDTNSCGCERNQKELGISVKYDFLEFWIYPHQLTLACVEGVSKNLREGKIRSRGRGWGERRILFLPTPSPFSLTPSPLLNNFLLIPGFSRACSISAWKRKGNDSYAG